MLSAIALHESGLNPFAQGQVGKLGSRGRTLGAWAGRCVSSKTSATATPMQKEPGACQKEVIDQAATPLATATKTCGSVERALGYYNTGRCQKNGYGARDATDT
ncbi:MAG: hypothetical protein IPL86_16345, partial [Flavobacteriales bacterium]|nr:hypothetical protein [Flavobacteriales bacterium]